MRFHEGLLQYSNSLETRCQFRWRQRSLLPCQSQLCPKSMWHFHGYAAMEWYYGAIWTIMDLHRGIRYNEASLVLMGHSDWTILDLSEHVWQLPDCHQEDVQLALRVVYAPMEDWLDLAVSMGPNLSHWWKGCISRVSKNGPLPQHCSWHPCSNSANALALRSGGFDCWHQEGMHMRISSYIIVSYTIVYHRIPISHHSLSTRMYQGRFSRSLALTASATELEVQGWDPLTWRQASDIGLFGILLTMQRRFQFTLGVLRNALPGSKSPGRLHSCGHPFRSRVLGGNRNKVWTVSCIFCVSYTYTHLTYINLL